MDIQANASSVATNPFFWLPIATVSLFFFYLFGIYVYILLYVWARRKNYPHGNISQPYVVNERMAKDVEDTGFKGTMSAYSTNIMRAGQALMGTSLLGSVVLTLLLGFNDVLAHSSFPYAYTVPKFVGYIAFILVGMFPSSDVTVDANGQPRRNYNAILFASLPLELSGQIHTISAFVYLFVPALANLVFAAVNIDTLPNANAFIGLTVFCMVSAIVFDVLYFFLQAKTVPAAPAPVSHTTTAAGGAETPEALLSPQITPIKDDDVSERKIGLLYFITFFAELVAFAGTIFTYYFIELSLLYNVLSHTVVTM